MDPLQILHLYASKFPTTIYAVHHYQILQITLTVFHLDMITPIWVCFFLASTLRSHWKWIGRKETFSEFLTAALYVKRLVKFLSDQWFTRVLLCSSSSVSLQENGLVPLQSYAFFIYFSLYVSSNDFSFFFFFGSL